jgi:hypothetical protein
MALRHYAQCATCAEKQRPAKALFECAMCKGTYYCNERCQRAHWPAHAAVCAATSATMLRANGLVDDLDNDLTLLVFMEFPDTEEGFRAALAAAEADKDNLNYVNSAYRHKYAEFIGPPWFAPDIEADADSNFWFDTRWIRRYYTTMLEFKDIVERFWSHSHVYVSPSRHTAL